MKKIKVLKLNTLSEQVLSEKEQNRLKGGANCCICECYYGSTSASDGNYCNLRNINDGGGYGNGAYS